MTLIAAAGNDGGQGICMVSDTGRDDLSSFVVSVGNIYANYYISTYAVAICPYGSSQACAIPISLASSATLVPILFKGGSFSDRCGHEIYNGIDAKGESILALKDVTHCKFNKRRAIARESGTADMLIKTFPHGTGGLFGSPNFTMGLTKNRAGQNYLKIRKKYPRNTFIWSKKPSTIQIEGGGHHSTPHPSVWMASFGPILISLLLEATLMRRDDNYHTNPKNSSPNQVSLPAMSLFKSNKNKTSSAASTPAQTPRTSIQEQRTATPIQATKMTREQALQSIMQKSMRDVPFAAFVM
ncbi:hypothetical protein BG011_005918 [Mortierella polycephala]|uniref:Uncharacterized protein n=1 Tax=Mortierella polycephala TaxID=41804 RepID=A0A9P6PW69_9FUNG|nr:hypothetical protein BG011_005918 [Mortierella polycephala]